MSSKESSELLRETAFLEFIFPNEYPTELVKNEIELILAHRYLDPQFVFDHGANIGTIWHIETTYISRKPVKDIDEMNIEELRLELLAIKRLSDEF